MSNRELTGPEIIKILQLYEGYGTDEKSRAAKLPEFLQMLWGEAYDLGVADARAADINKSPWGHGSYG
jgi:hypothetical protein